jgi:predicted GIY-YIG superfamily endonuclease
MHPKFAERVADNCMMWMREFGETDGATEIEKRLDHFDRASQEQLSAVLNGRAASNEQRNRE